MVNGGSSNERKWFCKGESELGGELKVWHTMGGEGVGVFGGSYGSRILSEGGMKRSQVLLLLLGK